MGYWYVNYAFVIPVSIMDTRLTGIWTKIFSKKNPSKQRFRFTAITMWILRVGFSHADIYVFMCLYLLAVLNFVSDPVAAGKNRKGKSRTSGKAGVEETEAIERLSEVFGIEHAPQHSVRSTPPQFMIELFNDITDSGGLIRKDGPYNASTVVSFPDRGKLLHIFSLQSIYKQRLAVWYKILTRLKVPSILRRWHCHHDTSTLIY